MRKSLECSVLRDTGKVETNVKNSGGCVVCQSLLDI